MPFPVEAESRTVESEAQGIGASIVNFFRTLADHLVSILKFAWLQLQRLITWSINNPEKAILLFGSLIILFG
jgi:hypothetical protein